MISCYLGHRLCTGLEGERWRSTCRTSTGVVLTISSGKKLDYNRVSSKVAANPRGALKLVESFRVIQSWGRGTRSLYPEMDQLLDMGCPWEGRMSQGKWLSSAKRGANDGSSLQANAQQQEE